MDDTFTYCARSRPGATTTVRLSFDDRGRLARIH
jgi:hypothetical protein